MCEVQAFSGWCPDAQEGGVEDLFLAVGLLASGPKRYGSKHGLREVVGEFHEPDSEGTVSESAGWLASSHLRGCSEETDEILVLVNMVYNRSSEGRSCTSTICGSPITMRVPTNSNVLGGLGNQLADSNSIFVVAEILFFERFEFFGVFRVPPHATRLYICMCCGLFVPTQFHFECCGVLDFDDSR